MENQETINVRCHFNGKTVFQSNFYVPEEIELDLNKWITSDERAMAIKTLEQKAATSRSANAYLNTITSLSGYRQLWSVYKDVIKPLIVRLWKTP